MTSNIFLIKNDGNIAPIGTIVETVVDNEVYNTIDLTHKTGISSVDQCNSKILDLFGWYQSTINTYGPLVRYFRCGDVELVLFKIMRWRGATAFIFIQKSARGVRLLAYISDKVMHKGQGTVIGGAVREIVSPDGINSITEDFKKIRNSFTNGNFDNIDSASQMYRDNIVDVFNVAREYDFREIFGI